MSKLVLELDKTYSGPGNVLFSKGNDWIVPTGVFIPEQGFNDSHETARILLWFHGYYVKDVRYLFHKEATNLLQAVDGAKKDVILVAPQLGWYQSESSTTYDSSRLSGGKKTELYLNQVLDAVSEWWVDTYIAGEMGMIGGPRPRFGLSDLYVAGHSGGGMGIRYAVASLGAFKDQLRECWGFDCLYGSGGSWHTWASGQGGKPLYFYYGTGTKPAFNGCVLDFWKRVYGTPKHRLGVRMHNMFLAPALPGTAIDSVAFQSTAEILGKKTSANRYEEVRRLVDPLLDNEPAYWSTIMANGLKGHYEVVSELLGPRVRQSVP